MFTYSSFQSVLSPSTGAAYGGVLECPDGRAALLCLTSAYVDIIDQDTTLTSGTAR